MQKLISTAVAAIILVAASWIYICFLVKAITMCFDLTFTWKMATGVWLILILLKTVFTVNVKK